MNRQFETWLRSGETNLLFLKLERESYIFLRLPKRPGFDYLFAQRQYRGDGALHADDFEYAGIYNAADGLVYDADYALIHAEGLDDTLAERSKGKKRREALAMLDKYVTDTYPPVKGAPLPSAELERENNYSNVRYTKRRNYEL